MDIGHEIIGTSASSTVILKVHVLLRPAVSMAVYVITCVAIDSTLPIAVSGVIDATPTLSVAVAAVHVDVYVLLPVSVSA
jgi:hypothetical protein